MAEKVGINPLITPTTRDLLKDACQTRKVSQGDLIEAAILAYVHAPAVDPGTDVTPRDTSAGPGALFEASLVGSLVLEKLAGLDKAIAQIEQLLRAIVTHLTPETPPPKIATYDQMYGPIVAVEALEGSGIEATLLTHLDQAPAWPEVAAADPLPAPPPTSRFKRWFVRDEGTL